MLKANNKNLSSNSISIRQRNLKTSANDTYDVIIIGGGITGAGIALDASLRGLKILLLEKNDFASGTSSKSTKLIHGGLRYLKQLNFSLVRKTGKEREVIHAIAPHLVQKQPLIVPVHSWTERLKLAAGLWLYDRLAGVKKADRNRYIPAEKAASYIPGFDQKKWKGAFLYPEYRALDSRLVIELIKTAAAEGATCLNYAFVGDMEMEDPVKRVHVQDRITHEQHTFQGKVIINAAGPWSDIVASKKSPTKHLILTKGVHLVINKTHWPIQKAIYFENNDGRMIFAIPQYESVYIGTTDTFYREHPDVVKAEAEDIDYILSTVGFAFPDVALSVQMVEGVWAGIRPLIGEESKSPSEISRKDEVFEQADGLITITGGKLTGYRLMARKITDLIEKRLSGQTTKCRTAHHLLSGGTETPGQHQCPDGFDQEAYQELLGLFGDNTEKTIATYRKYLPMFSEDHDQAIFAAMAYGMEYEYVQRFTDVVFRRSEWMYFYPQRVKKVMAEALQVMASVLEWPEGVQKEEEETINTYLQQLDELK